MSHEDARARLVDRLADRCDPDERTLGALRAVPRHEFVPDRRRDRAYEDRPLPIGEDQTISAPHMVAIISDLLDPDPTDRVLEIGTGCGYHAAVTAELAGSVYSVEVEASLARAARGRLDRLGYGVSVRVGDGQEGWPEHAPYDGAYLTCAPASVPEAIPDQVRAGGYVLAPVGEGRQRLVRLVVGEDGVERREDHGGVRFVEMRGG